MDVKRLVGNNLAQLRRDRGLSQEAFSAKSGFTQGYISDLERGRRNPTIVTLYHLSVALDLHTSALLHPAVDTTE
jgi:transcriptional regulator with XRE-family HTH domain